MGLSSQQRGRVLVSKVELLQHAAVKVALPVEQLGKAVAVVLLLRFFERVLDLERVHAAVATAGPMCTALERLLERRIPPVGLALRP
jgi:hypothetical protein